MGDAAKGRRNPQQNFRRCFVTVHEMKHAHNTINAWKQQTIQTEEPVTKMTKTFRQFGKL